LKVIGNSLGAIVASSVLDLPPYADKADGAVCSNLLQNHGNLNWRNIKNLERR